MTDTAMPGTTTSYASAAPSVRDYQPPAPTNQPIAPAPKKKFPLKYILGSFVLVLFVVALGAASWLSQQSQDIRQQASSKLYDNGSQCKKDSECQSGNCDGISGTCKPAPTSGGQTHTRWYGP